MSDRPLPPGYAETDIAIVGMTGRFPGASDLDAFWHNIREGIDAGEWLEDDALREAGVSEAELQDPDYVKVCHPIEDMEGFDAAFFGFSPREAAIMDPQQRHFLELAWAALEHAGHAPEAFDGAVGVFAGCGASLYLMKNLLTNPDLVENVGFFLLRHTGNDKDFLATRVSYLLNLTGPSVNVQTACSTSLVAVHQACQSLLMNECDLALAGGSTLKQPHRIGYTYHEGEILSPDGHCRTFDAAAEGTVFGSGSGVVVLRRLTDALEDGDTIHAVIKGSAINNDGSAKVGYLAPSVDAQARNMAEALAIAGVEPGDVGYVECHGTATPVGDPIEVLALSQAFGDMADAPRSIALGSVKTNIGHLDTAAGVAGLIKTVCAIKHAEIPPSLHFESPNPAIDFESSPFYVSAERRPWPRKGPHRIAAVGALGAGGTNAHVILQEPPARPDRGSDGPAWHVYPLSAKTPTALGARAADLTAHLRRTDQQAGDIARTLQVGRAPLEHRRFAVARDLEDLAARLEDADPKAAPSGRAPDLLRSVTFMFAGGGAQHPGMGRDLYEGEPAYREAVDACISLLQPDLDWDLMGLLYPDDGLEAAAKEMERPSRSLPCLFITQYAMARLLMAWGIEPAAMIGHSMGEYTAAHLAGVFSLADALSLVTMRGKLFETVPRGGMLSVPLGADELRERLPEDLSVAAANAPGLSVASGPVAALDRLEQALQEEDIESSRIRIDIAAHSGMLESILDPFGRFCAGITYATPSLPFISNVTGTWIGPEEATDPGYWVRHLRQTVLFADGVGELLADDGRVLIEVGPGRILATLAGFHESKRPTHAILTTMRHPAEERDDVAVALETVGNLWLAGYSVNWDVLRGGEATGRVPLPTYPFEHERYFIEPGEPTVARPTLDRRADVAEWLWRPAWKRATLTAVPEVDLEAPWLVFRDAEGVGAVLAERVARAGARVVSVLAAEAFERLDERTYRLDPAEPSHFEALFSSLDEDGLTPGRIVHTWAVCQGPVEASRTFYSLLSLAQAIGTQGLEDPIRIDVLTAGGQYVGGEPVLEPDRSLVLGPVRVIPKEFPNVACRAIDFGPPGPGWFEDRMVSQALVEMAHEGDEAVVAWRGVERYVQSFEPLPLGPQDEDVLNLGDGAVWLITGGLGGLGLVVAQELARRAKVRLVLTSRAGGRSPAVDALEELGAEVLVVAADVTDEAAMRHVVQETHDAFGPIHGIVHAAGVVEDALVLMKDPQSAARVLAPKVRGTEVLESATRGEPLKRVVYFSSRGAYAGVAGQVDYTSASAYLDAHALRRSQLQGLPVVSLDWCAWEGVGIAAGGVTTGRPVDHPLLDRCTVDEDERRTYQGMLSPNSQWLLDGHRLRSGEALIPGTGYLELILAAGSDGDLSGTYELSDVFFFSPFMVPDGGRRELRIDLERDGDGWDVAVQGRAPGARADWEEHSRASVARVDRAPHEGSVAEVRARCTARLQSFEGGEQRNANLTLGHRWSNLVSLAFGDGEALAELRLPADVAAETTHFAAHPALLDVACACAQELVPGFDTASQFFIPVSYGRVTVFDRLPARCFSHIRLQPGAGPDSDTAVYDVTILAEDGRVVIDIADFTMMRVREGASVSSQTTDTEADRNAVRDAGSISPDEGLEVLRRVLGGNVLGQVVVSPQHLETYLESLTAPPEEEPVGAPPRPSADLVDASAVESALAEHEAVDQAVVVAHRTPDGSVNATAFIVWELGEEVTIAELRRFLRDRVDEELLPSNLVELEELPVNGAGEVDRGALPDPFAPVDDHVPPTTEMELAIEDIWKELLGVARVSVHDNFLDVGGHSLLAMRAISRIAKRTGVRLNPSVMTLNTLGQIAAECEATAGAAT